VTLSVGLSLVEVRTGHTGGRGFEPLDPANPALFPEKYQLLEVKVPDDVYASMVFPSGGSPASRAFYKILPQTLSRKKGNTWLRNSLSALAGVPSFPSPYSLNILLNPKHPDARRISIKACRRIRYDRRLFHIYPTAK
jgi:hypothetical protein